MRVCKSLVLSAALLLLANLAVAGHLAPGTRILTNSATSVRSGPSAVASLQGIQPARAAGMVVSGPVSADGILWWEIDYDSGADGWSDDSAIVVYYFPPPESSGGWRSLVTRNVTPTAAEIALIRDRAGLDWNKLKLAADLSTSRSSTNAVIVVRNGWIAGEWGTASAVNVASVTKSLTGLAVAKLFDMSNAGVLGRTIGPESLAYQYLPGSFASSDPRKQQIRIRQMLSMSSGIQALDSGAGTLEEALTYPMAADPGTLWSYASLPPNLLSVIVQDLSGQTLQDFFTSEIATPIGMASFFWGTWNGYTMGSANAALDARSLARLGYVSLRQGVWDSGTGLTTIVNASVLASFTSWDSSLQSATAFESVEPHFATDPNSHEYYGRLFWTNRTTDALGTSVPTDAYYMHGWKDNLCIIVPSLDMVVVRLATGGAGVDPSFTTDFMARIMAAVVPHDVPSGLPVTVTFEAESGARTSPMTVKADSLASGGQFVEVPEGTGNNLNDTTFGGPGEVRFSASVPQSGSYAFWARTIAPNGTSDSFYVTRGGSLLTSWSVPRSTAWQWNKITTLNLSAGSTVLAFRQREDGTRLDQVLLTTDSNLVPGGNVAPVVSNPGAQSSTVGVADSLQIVASDADADPLTYGASGLPAGLSINTSSGWISGTPTSAGSPTVTVTVSDGHGGADAASFVWTVTGGTYALTPTSVAFGDQALNLTSSAKTITLTNTGSVALQIAIALSGTNPDQFVQTNDCGPSVPAAATCTIIVAFRPTTAGSKTAAVAVTVGSGAGAETVSLSGNGIAPKYSVSPTKLGFGNVVRGATSASKIVTISNTATVALPLDSIAVTGTNADQFVQTNDCPAAIAVGDSCAVSVVFKPTRTGKMTGKVTITPGGGASVKSVALSGTGT